MIVPAKRTFFSPEFFRELVPGKTRLEIDSGLGGSHTVVFKTTRPDGMLEFAYDMGSNPDWKELHGRPFALSPAKAQQALYTLAPAEFEFAKPLPRYAIRVKAYGPGLAVRESIDRMERDNMSHLLVSIALYATGGPAIPSLLWERPASYAAEAVASEMTKLIHQLPANREGGDTFMFETLTAADWQARSAGLQKQPTIVATPAVAGPIAMPPLPAAKAKASQPRTR